MDYELDFSILIFFGTGRDLAQYVLLSHQGNMSTIILANLKAIAHS